MSKELIKEYSKNVSRKDAFCEKIGYFFFDITKFFNKISTYCLFKSSAKNRIEEETNKREKREDVGKKIIDFSEDIADVISEPIEKFNTMNEEIQTEKFKAFNAETELGFCEEFVYLLYGAWLKNDNEELSKLFESRGFFYHLGEEND